MRIEVKRGARLGMAKQALNRLHVFASVDKKGREAVAEVVESESLPTFKPDSDPNRGGMRRQSNCIDNVDTERMPWHNVDTMSIQGGLAI